MVLPSLHIGIIWYVTFCYWHLPLSMIVSRFIRTVACVRTSFLFRVKEYSIVWIYQVSFSHSSVSGHVGCVYPSAAKDCAILLIVALWCVLVPQQGHISAHL